jgi:cytochrome c
MGSRLIGITLAGALLGVPLAAATAQSGPPTGEALFRQRCQTCHANVAGRPAGIGPNLAGVVGRKAASTPFNYSPALKASGLTWTRANLDRFLTGPARVVPGTRMVVSVTDNAQRAALINYLASGK